ncbi:MAG: efflux RND transporter permease subunit [Planctomycetia bacterium]|nr:efflux RND transporter permease subunit [Planctomycetia bacterium]
MNIALAAVKNRKVTYTLSAIMFLAGIYAYTQLGRLEMPDFTMKVAVVMTPYSGASPSETEREVTQVIEEALQRLPDIKELYSVSQDGLSIVYIEMSPDKTMSELPQIWDELRRKVNDCQSALPPGAGPSIVNDDFADVYGVFYALSLKDKSITPERALDTEHYDPTMRRLRLFAKELKKEILLCRDVKRIEYCGDQRDVVYLEFRHSKAKELGISAAAVLNILQSQNLVEASGKVDIGDKYIRINPEGNFLTTEDIADLLVVGPNGAAIRLGEVVHVRRGYLDPPDKIVSINGKPALGFGVSTISGGNAVKMAESVEKKIAQLKASGFFPDDIEIDTIANQGATVTEALDGFVVNLIESVAIVVVLLMLFMGWQSGLLIGVILLLTIFATFIYMWLTEISMQIVSLGALILALGMLVDNAIVIAEGVIIGVQRGKSREEAAAETVQLNQWPLLGATIIAVLAFAAIGFAPGNTGEVCQSLFWVMASSLMLSWIFAVTATPLLCVDFLKIPKIEGSDPYDRPMYRAYRMFLEAVLRKRRIVFLMIAVLLIVSAGAFVKYVPQSFFPDNPRGQFFVDCWFPQGTSIKKTSGKMKEIEEYLIQAGKRIDEEKLAAGTKKSGDPKTITQVAKFVGGSPIRFMLIYDIKDPNTSYGHLLITVGDKSMIGRLKKELEDRFKYSSPDLDLQVSRFSYSAPSPYKIECYLRGPDPKVLHNLSDRVQKIMREEKAWDISDDWRQPVEVKRPVLNETRARYCGITRSDAAKALQMNFNGLAIGVYREGEDLMPLIARPESDLRLDYNNIDNIQVISSALGNVIPLSQIIDDPNNSVFEDGLIRRRHQVKTISAHCNPAGEELPSETLDRIKPRVEKEIVPLLPAGYNIEWAGEYKSSNEASEPLGKAFPVCLGLMFLILICQFNQFRPPMIIFCTLPLAVIGVAWGLILPGLPFSFMAILGFLGLSGMLIKNGIVLIEQIQYNRGPGGMDPYNAVVDAAVSRLRPVTMAAGTTVLGMFPLMWDVFYSSMAATVAGGLIGATVLTLIIIPIFYVMFYRINCKTVDGKI